MRRTRLYTSALSAAILNATIAMPAFAHPGHGLGAGRVGGFVAGLLHPVSGWDHLAAMLLIGAWAGSLSRLNASRQAPAIMFPAFLAAMFAGFASGALFGQSMVEGMVFASVIVATIAIISRWSAPLPVAATLTALFGFVHGQAHGIDLPDGAAIAPFAAGFLLASAGLLATGAAAARGLLGARREA